MKKYSPVTLPNHKYFTGLYDMYCESVALYHIFDYFRQPVDGKVTHVNIKFNLFKTLEWNLNETEKV